MSAWVYIISAVSLLFLLILFTPIRYEMVFNYHGAVNLRAVVKQFLFFSASFEKNSDNSATKMRLMGVALRLPAGDRKPKNKKISEPPNQSRSAWKLLQSFIRNNTYRPLWKLLVNILQGFKPDHLAVKGEFGFFEPHYTAWANILFSIIPSYPPDYTIRLEPVWDDETLDIEAYMNGSFTLANLTRHLIVFVFSVAFIKFMLDTIRNIKRSKTKMRKIKMQPLKQITGINN